MKLRSNSSTKEQELIDIKLPNTNIFIPFLNERNTLGKLTELMPKKPRMLYKNFASMEERFRSHLKRSNRDNIIHKINQSLSPRS
jgi:hypothetical protein